jgi:hypothetical protein
MTKHMTGTRKEWLAARLELLEAEKELTSKMVFVALQIVHTVLPARSKPGLTRRPIDLFAERPDGQARRTRRHDDHEGFREFLRERRRRFHAPVDARFREALNPL